MAIPSMTIIMPITLPSLYSSILFAINEPDTAPMMAAEPATNAAPEINSSLRICPMAPEPEIKNIIIRAVPTAV